MEMEIEPVSFHEVNFSKHSVSGVHMNILSSLMHTVFFKLRFQWFEGLNSPYLLSIFVGHLCHVHLHLCSNNVAPRKGVARESSR